MRKRQLLSLTIVVIAVTTLVTVVAFHQQAQDRPQPPNQGTKSKSEELTDIKVGVPSGEELAYTKEYKDNYSLRGAKKLTDRNAKEEVHIEFPVGDGGQSDSEPEMTSARLFEQLSCAADAVVLGTVKDRKSHLSADQMFVYSQYEFGVDSIFKNNDFSPIIKDQSISFTRPGGNVKIGDLKVFFHVAEYPSLKIGGRYLLFLKYVREAGGYKVFDTKSDFELGDESIRPVSTVGVPNDMKDLMVRDDLIRTVRSSTSKACSKTSLGDDQ